MQRVSIDDPAWRSTFPHPVAPLDDEWLAGLLLRCDEANHWESRTTFTHLWRSKNPRTYWNVYRNLIVPRMLNLDTLAYCLALPTTTLLATTYHVELANCFETSDPHPWQLTPSFSLRICPQCIEQERLLKRAWLLPHIRFCPLHYLELIGACQCGMSLELFYSYGQPFTCDACDLDWGKLPRISADPKRIELEQKYLSIYNFFFSQGNPLLLNRAWRLVKEQVMRGKKAVFPPNRAYTFRGHMPVKTEILCVLVSALVFFDFSPQDILTYAGPTRPVIREKFPEIFISRIYLNSILSE